MAGDRTRDGDASRAARSGAQAWQAALEAPTKKGAKMGHSNGPGWMGNTEGRRTPQQALEHATHT